MSDKDSDISNDAMPLPGMLPLQSHSEEDSCSNSTADVSTEPSISVENECLGEGTTPKTPCLGPGIIQPLGSGSSIYTEISPPHDQWAFNALLIKLAKQIDDNDLLQMKEMYNGGIPRRILNDIKNPLQLFNVMQKKAFLSSINLLQLQGLFWNIGKLGLMNMVIDYARQSENIVYLQPASVTPVNGYTHVKFHIRGKQFGTMTRGQLQYLRTVAANTVLIPSSFVLIDGINPSSSVVITMQFPEQHANIFRIMLELRELELGELIEFGVDLITIGDTSFKINESPEENSGTFTNEEVDVSIKLHWAEKKITNLEEEIKTQADKFDVQMFSLKAQNCMLEKECKVMEELFSVDKIQADILYVESEVLETLTRSIIALEDMEKENRQQLSVLQMILGQATLLTSICFNDVSQILKDISTKAQYMQGTMIMKAVHGALQLFIGDSSEESALIKTMKEVSMKIHQHEVQKLEKINGLTESERNEVRSGSSSFLLVLFRKEFDRKGFGLNFEEFPTKCFMSIDRPDLLQEFYEKLAQYAKDDIRTADGNSTTDTQSVAKPYRKPHISDIKEIVKCVLLKLSEMGKQLQHLPEFGQLDSELRSYRSSLYKKIMERSKSSW